MASSHGGLGTVSEIEWQIPANAPPYARVELHARDGRKAWTNPIFFD